jgi:uncharacterized membrane protein YhaH (DUF805 family)
LIANIPAVIASIAVGIKRLNDRNKSGWWLLLFYLVPGLLDVIVIFIEGSMLVGILGIAGAAIVIWMIVELGFRRGTVGPNQYGPDPLEGTTTDGLPEASI